MKAEILEAESDEEPSSLAEQSKCGREHRRAQLNDNGAQSMAVDGRQWSNGDGETECQTSDRAGISEQERGRKANNRVCEEKNKRVREK